MKRAREAGFTLIELVVVMVIIGILAAVAIPQFSNVQQNAKDAVAQGICGSLQSAAVILFASNKTAASYSNVQGQVTTSGGTATYTGNCAGPSVAWTPTGGTVGSTVACAAVPATLCTP
jgi:MSHA pilin protein MshA